MVSSLYRDRSSYRGGSRRFCLAEGAAVFAEVVVDIPARELGCKLFTYRVPEHLANETFIGAQVLVPFGGQELVGGYVVALKEQGPPDLQIRDVVDVLDSDPLFDRQYVDFLYWVADYYCAPLSAVIGAAVPADFGLRLKRLVERVPASERQQQPIDPFFVSAAREDVSAARILDCLAETPGQALTLRSARQRCRLGNAQFYRSLALLRQAGAVRIRTESTATAPKVVNTVIWTGEAGRTPRQEAVIALLRKAGGQMSLSGLVQGAGTTYATIRRMCEQNILKLMAEEVIRDPLERVLTAVAPGTETPPELTADQGWALARLADELDRLLADGQARDGAEVEPFLLHGVTGSGKTEIYLRLIAQTMNHNRSALLLVPEISLTPQLAQRLKSRFGRRVAVWHSALSVGERYDTWRRIRSGDVRVLLGARSAVLVSMPDLGLIILDEEHDASYKQSSPSPRYHAKRLALEKARRLSALVVLGSATPDVGSYLRARETKRLLELPERVFRQALPEVSVVDMRQEVARGNHSIFSQELMEALASGLERGDQAILLMNRRGYANHVFCRACGFVVKCRNCSVSLVFHQPAAERANAGAGSYLSCHHCGFSSPATATCPSCAAPFLRQYGLGTQRVEQDLQDHFPQARLLRLDSDVAARKGAYETVFDTFSAGRADILIGTQMVAKGLDIPAVTLVGVLAADAAFNLPDYRSMERGFQLLTQVSGRAGRGHRPGRVILQTFNTELPALRLARAHDYKRFAEEELAARKELAYPPFSQIVRVVVSGPEQDLAEFACERLAEELTNFLGDQVEPEAVRVLGPAPCLIERLRGNWRFHLLVKNLAGERGRALVTSFLRGKRPGPGLTLAVDVDAFDLI